MYMPNIELMKQFTSSPTVCTFFSSVMNPLMAKYKNPPDVRARHSFRYSCPTIDPIAVPIREPSAEII